METQTANNHGPRLIYGTGGFNQHHFIYNGVTQESPGPKQVKGTGNWASHHKLAPFNINVHLLIPRPLTQTDHRQEHFYLERFELINVSGWLRGSCTWSWPVVGAALAARCAVTERQEAERRWWKVPLLLPPSPLYIIHSSISPADTVQWCENKQWRLRRAFAAIFLSWNRTGADRETSAVDPKMRSACVCLQGKVSC